MDEKKRKIIEAYWLKQLAGDPPAVTLPIYRRYTDAERQVEHFFLEMSPSAAQPLIKMSKGADIALFILYLSGINILLHRYTANDDLLLGSAAPTKDGQESQLLLLRNRIDGDPTCKEFISRVKQTLLNAINHGYQPYDFNAIFEKLQNKRQEDAHTDNLFNIAVIYEPFQSKIQDLHRFDLVFVLSRTQGENSLQTQVYFNASLYESETLKQFCQHLDNLFSQWPLQLELPISQIDFIDDRAKQQILIDFNHTATDFPRNKTIGQLFREQAQTRPHSIALVGRSLAEPTGAQHAVTYDFLNRESDHLAGILKQKGVGPGTVVALLIDRSIEMIIGILGIIKAGGAYLPLDPSFPQERIRFMVADTCARILLTHSKYSNRAIPGMDVIHLEDPSSFAGVSPIDDTDENPGDPVYIIYTSGTTGIPKGNVTTHTNVIRVVKETNYIQLNSNDRLLQLSNYAFDGSVFDIFGALLNGAALVLPDEGVAGDSGQLAALVKSRQITVFFVTTALFNLLVDLEINCFDNVRNVLFGGERVSLPHSRRALAYMGAGRIIHVYGPTEATVYATHYPIHHIEEHLGTVPIGKPIANTVIHILDNHMNPVPIGVPGEIHIGGEGVAQGYLNRPELTAQKFFSPIASHPSYPSHLSHRSYRTGDLARWLPDGNIEFLDRIDQQVKIRGFRIELGEIENRLIAHESVQEAVVIARTGESGDAFLCAFVVPGVPEDVDLKEYLSETLPPYMIPTFFVPLKQMPLTPNGKVDRNLLTRYHIPDLKPGTQYAPPRDERDRQLVEIWSLVLGMDTDRIGIDDDFFDLGGHSLKGTVLIAKIHKALNVRLSLAALFKIPTIRQLADFIRDASVETYRPIPRAEIQSHYPLSSAQKRLFILAGIEKGSTGYNMPLLYRLGEIPDPVKLETIFRQLIARHDSLRTRFYMKGEEPVQEILSDVPFSLETHSPAHNGFSALDIVSAFIRPFHLDRAPLLRAGLLRDGNDSILMVDMHHIISDGTSCIIFLEEFTALYDGKQLEPLRLQYKDFAQWQNSAPQKEKTETIKDYWLTQFSGEIPVLNLPYDFSRPAVQSFDGDIIGFQIHGETADALRALAKREGVTLFMVFLAVFNILLSKLGGTGDVIIGTPTAGRSHPDLESIVGMFVNTLALRNFPKAELTFTQFLADVKQRTLSAFDHQDFQFEDLVDALEVKRDTGRNPLFDVMIGVQNIDSGGLENRGPGLTPYDQYKSTIAKFDLNLNGFETDDAFMFSIEYGTRLFKAETIRRFIGYYKTITACIAQSPDIKLYLIDMLSAEEKDRLLNQFNRTETPFPADKIVSQFLEEQACNTPEKIAVTGQATGRDSERQSMTYRQLNQKANQLARLLREKGAGPDSIIGVLADRSLEMIVAIYAVLKAGAAYLPIDPAYPAERIRYMLEYSRSTLLLTQERFMADMSFNGETIDLGDSSLYNGNTDNLDIVSHAENLIYVIYTSGSTGKPKGVMVKIGGFVNLIYWYAKEFGFDSNDTVLLVSPNGFDLTQKNMFSPLMMGGGLSLASPGLPDYQELSDIIAADTVTIVNCAPSMFYPLVDFNKADGSGTAFAKLAAIRYLFLGGEPIRFDRLAPWFRSGGCRCRLVNTYGPTECTDVVSYFRVEPGETETLQNIPIGIPVYNTALYILDKHHRLIPMGAAGELCIGGVGVSRGYLDNPQMTAETFVLTPHLPSPVVYRTGDIVRRRHDGNILFIGRADHQVKVRGNRIELGEIESCLTQHEALKDAVVIDRQREGDTYLCAYIVPRNPDIPLETAALRDHLSRALPEYMIPAFFVTIPAIPVTPHGKTDRNALPEPEIGGDARNYTPPRDAIDETMTTIWANVLKLDKERIGIDDNFFELGGHSLKATVLITEIHKTFHVSISLGDIFKAPVIRRMSDTIKGASKSVYTPMAVAEKREYYPLSFAQRRLWILSQFEEEATAYNMPFVFVITGPLDVSAFEKALQMVIRRHDSLRTRFITVDGEPRQQVLDHLDYRLEQTDLRSIDQDELEEKARAVFLNDAARAFDLEKGPLFFLDLVRLEEEQYLSIFNIHHIINDGWSQGILTNELFTLYNLYMEDIYLDGSDPLPPVTLQYKDYTLWHNDLIDRDQFRRLEDYWLEKFSDKPNGIQLPLDHPRRPVQTFNGRRVTLAIDAETRIRIQKMCADESATMFMGLLLLLSVFQYRYSGQQDIIIGSPIAGRRRSELNNMIGFLVNTIVFRTTIQPHLGFKQLLADIRRETLDVYENQDYPFDVLIERLQLDRDLSQSPLFNVMLAHNNAETEEEGLGMKGLQLSGYEYSSDFNMSKFDVIYFMDELADKVYVVIEYNSDLFDHSTVQHWAGNFLQLVDSVIADPQLPVMTLDIISPAEKQMILETFNHTNREYPELTVRQLFENRVAITPDATAVIYKDRAISYRLLNERANWLAHCLIGEYRAVPNRVIGIFMDRSLEMITVILGIIKSGAGYVAIDPNYPEDRILHMLSDSDADLLLMDGDRSAVSILDDYQGTVIDINARWEFLSRLSADNPDVKNQSTDILYVIYTSGSTGTPNGAMLSHRLLANLVQWQDRETGIDGSMRCLQFTSINFCVSFQESMTTLTSGGQLYLIGDVQRQDIDYLMDFLSKYRIQVLYLPFSYLNFLFNESERWGLDYTCDLQHIITAGEQLKISTAMKRFLDRNPHIRVHNHYGSSEMHVVTSYTLDARDAGTVPIPPAGKPIADTRIYILDDHQQPVPIGVWGEIYVAGSTEVLGYINNSQLTREKLVDLPGLATENKRLYRSGDVGRWLESGNIQLKGRKDSQLKIRGFRVELGEIESKLLAVEAVNDCVVIALEDAENRKYLAAYVVAPGVDSANEIKRIISDSLPQYMIPKITLLNALPLMPNGKVDRERLPEPETDTEAEYVAPANPIEKKLVEIWADLLEMEPSIISTTANFFDLGGHSLSATRMMTRIHKALKVRIPLTDIFKTPFISEMYRHIQNASRSLHTGIPQAEKREYYPLSPAQRRVYIDQRKDSTATHYNMMQMLVLEGNLKPDRLQNAFRELVVRHHGFRTSFMTLKNLTVQRVANPGDVAFNLEIIDIPGDESQQAEVVENHVAGFIQPFDLTRPPLLRAGLIRLQAEKYVLMVDMHHIVSDGVSYTLFVKELTHLYDGRELPKPTLQYTDFAQWESSNDRAVSRERNEAYWLDRLASLPPALNLPYDYAVDGPLGFDGDVIGILLPKETKDALETMASDRDTTLFTLLLTVFYLLLNRVCRAEDIVIGVPNAGRDHADLESIIGMFVNSLPLRSYPKNKKTFNGFLSEVKENTLADFDHQDCRFEELPGLDGALFNVMFTYSSFRDSDGDALEIKLPGVKISPYPVKRKDAKFDLTLWSYEKEGGMVAAFEYRTQLFKKETIELLLDRFQVILNCIIENPDIAIENLEYKSEIEHKLTVVEEVDFDF